MTEKKINDLFYEIEQTALSFLLPKAHNPTNSFVMVFDNRFIEAAEEVEQGIEEKRIARFVSNYIMIENLDINRF